MSSDVCDGCAAKIGEQGLWDRHGIWHTSDDMEGMNRDVGDALFNYAGTGSGMPYDRLVTIDLTTNAWNETWCQRCECIDRWYALSPITAAYYESITQEPTHD